MRGFERCREMAKIAWDLLRREPRLAVISLGFALPALLTFVLYAVGGTTHALWQTLIFANLLPIGRIATCKAVFAALRNEPWTVKQTLKESAQHWKYGIYLGLIDIPATVITGWLVIYALFGTFAAAFWWCLAALIPCATATGYIEPRSAVPRANRVFTIIRTELLLASVLIVVALSLLLSLFNALGFLGSPGGKFLFVVILVLVREVYWQVFVGAAYFQNAPAPY